jgi:hypothetical protein
LKQATLILALLGAIVLAGCSSNSDTASQTSYNNGSGSQPFKPKTHLSHRSIVSNYNAGALDVMDTTQDRLLTNVTFPVGAEPTYLQLSPDATLTFVNNTASNSISTFDNFQETVRGTIQLGGWTQSFVTSKSNEFGFAAVPNISNGNPPSLPGGIVRFNPTDGSLNTGIQFPYVRYLAMDTAEQHLLAFTQDAAPTTVGAIVVDDNTAHWVDLTTNDPATGVPPYYSLTLNGNANTKPLSRPVAAFFSTDSSNGHIVAFILSCGYECGGSSSASVTEIDTTSIIPPVASTTGSVVAATVLNQWTVNGARIGLIDLKANKLYVAGSNATLIDQGGKNVQNGYFTVIDLTTGPTGTAIPIGNGVKRWIRNINGVYWVASLNCGVESCVTLVNPTAGTAAELANANGDATGISLAVNRGEVYTIEGGELFIYDQKGTPVVSQYNTDIHGQGSDVLYID